jgi:putative ABC transport system permease protein
MLVWDETAAKNDWQVGDRIDVEFARTGVQAVEVVGIYSDKAFFGADYVLSPPVFRAKFTDDLVESLYVRRAPGVSAADAERAIASVLASSPNVEVKTKAEFKQEQMNGVDQVLGLVFVLLGLSIIVALLGIVNTLALSIFERTGEIGLLRAVGMNRRQVRRMIRWESVLVSVLGAVLGIGIGVFFGWALVTALEDTGVSGMVLPGGQLVVFTVLAGLAGMAAAALPARRAARLDVLGAITHH